MQSPKRRKIHYKSRKDSFISEEQNLSYNKNNSNHCHKQKPKYTHRIRDEYIKKKSKKNKKLQSLNYTDLNHPKCISTYIGPERLTKHVGFLTKGKISDSISRLEKVMPDDLRARANQDLHRVLKFANRAQTNVSPFCNEMSSINLSCTDHYDVVNISPEKPAPSKPIKLHNDFFNATMSKVTQFVQTSASLFLQESCPHVPQEESSIVENTIANKLYPAIANSNRQIFSDVSLEETLKTELLFIKRQFNNNTANTPSSSSNCGSQDVSILPEEEFELNPVLTQQKNFPPVLRDNFELNPILTQEGDASKDLENMFPEAESSRCSSSEESIDYDYLPHLSDNKTKYAGMQSPLPGYELCHQTSNQSPELNRKFWSLKPHSPSSNGTPVWIPVVSPVKFVPDFPPTPKIYYRQKMF